MPDDVWVDAEDVWDGLNLRPDPISPGLWLIPGPTWVAALSTRPVAREKEKRDGGYRLQVMRGEHLAGVDAVVLQTGVAYRGRWMWTAMPEDRIAVPPGRCLLVALTEIDPGLHQARRPVEGIEFRAHVRAMSRPA